MHRPAGLSAAGMGRFVVVALGFAFGLWFVLSSPYRPAPLWQAWAPLLVALTTTAGAAFPYGLDRWAELGQLLDGHQVRVHNVASRVAAVVAVPLVIGVASTRLHGQAQASWRGVALVAVLLVGGVPAAGAMEGVRHAARNWPSSEPGGRQVAVLIKLRDLLQRLLAALGALVALWTFTIGAAVVLQRSLAGSVQGVVVGAPQQLVLIFGGVGSLLVALFYVPAAAALQRRGQNVCEELFPLHEAKEASAILSSAEDRHKLQQLLGIDRGVVADLQTGLAILGPLFGSAAAAFLTP